MVDRSIDLRWFENNRRSLSEEYSNQWIVVFKGEMQKVFLSEESAVEFAITEYGLEAASVFQATVNDAFVYIGGAL